MQCWRSCVAAPPPPPDRVVLVLAEQASQVPCRPCLLTCCCCLMVLLHHTTLSTQVQRRCPHGSSSSSSNTHRGRSQVSHRTRRAAAVLLTRLHQEHNHAGRCRVCFPVLSDVLVVAHPSVCVVTGGLGGAVQPGGQAYVSRWDTGSREAGSRGRSRGSDSDRDWEPEERGHRAGREVPTASVFLKVQRRPVCACVAAATGAACVGVTDAV